MERTAVADARAEVNRELVRHVDVLFGNEEDFSAGLGYDVEGMDDDLLVLDVAHYEHLLQRVLDELPAARGRRIDAASGADRDDQRLGRLSAEHGRASTSGRRSTASRSSTAWAAATRSPPG